MKFFWQCIISSFILFSVGVNAQEEQQESTELSEEEALFEQFKAAELDYISIKAYNDQLEKLVASQQNELDVGNQQILSVDATELEVKPLMDRMIDGLEQFIELDMPFSLDERRERVSNLRIIMEDSTVDDPERYRRIIEAYQIENDYGRDVVSTTAKLPGQDITVNLLRIGRVALVYQTLDGKQSAFWNQRDKKWELLSEEFNRSVKQGIRIALKRTSPNLITLPIPAPEVSQ